MTTIEHSRDTLRVLGTPRTHLRLLFLGRAGGGAVLGKYGLAFTGPIHSTLQGEMVLV